MIFFVRSYPKIFSFPILPDMVLPTRRTIRNKKRFPVKKKVAFKATKGLVRFRPSRARTLQNIATKNVLKNISESKLSAITPTTEAVPSAIQTGAQAYKYVSVLGVGVPSTWSGINHSLGGVSFPVGTGPNNRVGQYVYLRKTTIQMSIEATLPVDNPFPLKFRMIVFKARRAFSPAGVGYNPATTLFLKENGDPFGHATGGVNGVDLMLQPLNKRNWSILKDQKFMLQPPATLTGSSFNPATTAITTSSKYPNEKSIFLQLPHQIKARFAVDEPDDYDYRYCIAIYAHCITRDTYSNSWEVSIRGTTSALDN